MSFHSIPLLLFSIGTFLMVMLFIECGYKMGMKYHRYIKLEKVGASIAISSSTLGLFGFMLAFTFGILYNRFDDRKEMVRLEANAISSAMKRSAFMPKEDHVHSVKLLKEYVALRIAAYKVSDSNFAQSVISESERIQEELWQIALENTKKDINSNIAALYIQSLNEMTDIHKLRISRGYRSTAPLGLWLALYSLLFFSMISVGYQSAIVQSKRTLSPLFMALSFTIVIALIFSLDQPNNYFFVIPQEPLVSVQHSISHYLNVIAEPIKFP